MPPIASFGHRMMDTTILGTAIMITGTVVVTAVRHVSIERLTTSPFVNSHGVMMIQRATWVSASSRPRAPWNVRTERSTRLKRNLSLGSTTTCARRRRQSCRIGRSKNKTQSKKYGTPCGRVQAPEQRDITRRMITSTPRITKSWTTAPTTKRTFPPPSRAETRPLRTNTSANRIVQPVQYNCTELAPL